jgi:hypothetical protein
VEIRCSYSPYLIGPFENEMSWVDVFTVQQVFVLLVSEVGGEQF